MKNIKKGGMHNECVYVCTCVWVNIIQKKRNECIRLSWALVLAVLGAVGALASTAAAAVESHRIRETTVTAHPCRNDPPSNDDCNKPMPFNSYLNYLNHLIQ